MKKRHHAAAGLILLASAGAVFEFHALGQPPDYLALGESELSAGDLDLARRDLTQAFQIAQRNGDANTLLRLTNDFRILLEKAMPDASTVSDYEADVSGAFSSALDAAIQQACYDPSSPGSGTNVAAGQANLRSIIGFYSGLFGTPDTGASGLAGRLSHAALAAQSYLDSSLAGDPSCPPAPSPSPSTAPPPIPVPVPVPVPVPAPNPSNTSGGSPVPGPTDTSGPAPTGTSAVQAVAPIAPRAR